MWNKPTHVLVCPIKRSWQWVYSFQFWRIFKINVEMFSLEGELRQSNTVTRKGGCSFKTNAQRFLHSKVIESLEFSAHIDGGDQIRNI